MRESREAVPQLAAEIRQDRALVHRWPLFVVLDRAGDHLSSSRVRPVSILGNRVARVEDEKLLTTGGIYVADLDLPGVLELTYVTATMAHARITGLFVEDARAAPGVVAVVTAGDLTLGSRPVPTGRMNPAMARPFLAQDVVRYVGEPIVAIVAETREAGLDAAELVVVDYEPLPVVLDLEQSRLDETLLFPEAGTNVVTTLGDEADPELFCACEVVVRQRIVNQRLAPCPLETRAAAARPEPDGRLTFWASTQSAHGVREALISLLDLPPAQVHVIAPDVGGGFGAKGGAYVEELLVAHLARSLGRPVRFVETRSPSMLGLGHGRAQTQQIEIGGNRDGTILAYRLSVLQDAGAYPAIGALLPGLTRLMTPGTYDIAKAEFESISLVTNTTPTVAYRGAGRPEATAAIERAVDLFAAEIGMEPAAVRRKNLVPADRFPFTTAVGTVYDSGNYEGALDLVLDVAGYDDLRAEQAARRASGGARQLGIGLSSYVEITNGFPGTEFGAVEVRPDGTALVRTGTSPHGQGHATAWAMLVSEALRIPITSITVVHGDTDVVPRGIGTFGSRSLQTGGVAVHEAAREVVELGKTLAAELLEAAREDIVLDQETGSFSVAGTPSRSQSWGELALASLERSGTPLGAEVDLAQEGPTFPFGAHLAVVELDTETGKVQLIRHVAVDDAGTILNPLLADGQVHGGIAQGAAQALLEEFSYDEDGNPLTGNFADYPVISAAELPSFERISMQTPTPRNVLGVKGIGESGTIGSTPAVHNAVVDALSIFGVAHLDMPATPERVWRAIRAAPNSRPPTPD